MLVPVAQQDELAVSVRLLLFLCNLLALKLGCDDSAVLLARAEPSLWGVDDRQRTGQRQRTRRAIARLG